VKVLATSRHSCQDLLYHAEKIVKHFAFSFVQRSNTLGSAMALMPRERLLPSPSASSERAGVGQNREDLALVRDFDALYARYGKQIFNTIYQWIGDYEEAADLTQETFLSAHKAREQFRGDAKVYTWLYRIAHNHCKNRFKQRGRQREMEGPSLDAGMSGDGADFDETAVTREIADWSQSPPRLLEQKELEAQINRAVNSLAPEYRVVLVLREVDGLAYNEIAEVTGLTLEAVKTRLNRARAMVRQKVEPYLKI
jgi:RNA polymerase sigma-70 factor (ECF subfamily)